jgi:acetate kinase
MLLLVLNSGSSSLKFQLFDMPDSAVVLRGSVDRIGEGDSEVSIGGVTKRAEVADHSAALSQVEAALQSAGHKTIEAVGHRVVHGGELYRDAVIVDASVESDIEALADLAPLHNPPNLAGIRGAQHAFPDADHVVVFDSAFHQTLPPKAYLYAIPYDLYETHRIRRYGFHGTSHRYVSQRAAQLLGKDTFTGITCHLGNGCSIAAIRDGQSVDVSMGLTPLEGVAMGTRSGDLDPTVVIHIQKRLGMTPDDVDHLLNRESGLLGLTGLSNDVREVEAAADRGDSRAIVALDLFAYRIQKYIGAYVAVLGTIDAVVFTGGIGENGWKMRKRIVEGLAGMGLTVDPEENRSCVGREGKIGGGAAAQVLVIPTDEERMIAEDTFRLVRRENSRSSKTG